MYWFLKMVQHAPCSPSFLSLSTPPPPLSPFSSFCLPSVLCGETKAAACLSLSSHLCFRPSSSLCLHVVASLRLLFFCTWFKVQSSVFYCISPFFSLFLLLSFPDCLSLESWARYFLSSSALSLVLFTFPSVLHWFSLSFFSRHFDRKQD